MSKCRILIVGPRPWKRGGVPRVIANVATREASYPGVEPWIYCSSPDQSDLQRRSYQGVDIRVFRRQQHFPYLPYGMYGGLAQVRDNFDLVHLHGIASIEALIVPLAVRDRPIIVNPYYHREASETWLELFKKPFDVTAISWLLHKAVRLICVSSVEASTLCQKFGQGIADKITLIPCGVDSEAIRQAIPYRLDDTCLLLYAGRLEKFKNVHLIVNAMPHLPKHFNLQIIGTGPYRDHILEQVHDMQLEDRVHFAGAVSDQDLYRWLKTCSVFVTLSSYESFGITVLEALAAEKPAVVNDKWGLRELAQIFPETVVSVEAERISAPALARQIERACMLDVSVNLDQYSWDSIARSVLSVHLEICQKAGLYENTATPEVAVT